LAAHVFEQNRNVELAAPEHAKELGRRKVDFEPHVNLQLALEALADLARGDELALAAGERRVVDEKVERDGGLVDRNGGERLGSRLTGDRLADVNVAEARDHDDVARARRGRLDARESLEGKEFGDL